MYHCLFYSIKEGAHSSWLKAVITPIHKKGNKSLPSNYRPISLTSVLSKIMESIIRDEMLVHLTKQNHLCDEQHGFVPGRNCTTQLLLCLEEWTSMIEDKKDFDIIYTDFPKAFDSVAHQRLLLKLELFGITGEIMNWIKSFLHGRTQCVKIDGKVSAWKPVLSGVPQGSVIGPLLFVIFINDIPNQLKFNTCKLFADDCKLYGNLNELDVWTKTWQLLFNASKCKRLCILEREINETSTSYMVIC